MPPDQRRWNVGHPRDRVREGRSARGFSGIAYVVLFIAMGAAIAASAPDFTDGADELRERFADNQGPIAFFTWFAPMGFGVLGLNDVLAGKT